MAARIFTLFATAALALSTAAQAPIRACNNSPALCSRAYNNVTYLGAHDSPFVRNESNGYSVAGNQFFPSPVQLDAGVRLLTAQIHRITTPSGASELHLCHSLCQLYDAGTVRSWLTGVRSWLDNNSNEVVTLLLVNGDGATASDINAEFRAARLAHYAYTPSSTTQPLATWPTLNQLINRNKRLVVFVQPLAPASNTEANYLLDQFTFTFENNYDVSGRADFSCTANRPASLNGKTAQALASGRLPLLNHFLYEKILDFEIPDVSEAPTTNAPSGGTGNLGDAANACKAEYKKAPNYLLVDFFNAGPAIDTADVMNGLRKRDIVGRRKLPTQIYTDGPGPTATAPLSRTSTATVASSTPTTTKKSDPSSGGALAMAASQGMEKSEAAGITVGSRLVLTVLAFVLLAR